MKSITDKLALQDQVSAWKHDGLRVGFVPTMGALHAGHLSLVDIAHQNADRVIVSIFVNPAQFAPHEDLDTYPRTEQDDAKALDRAGVHAIYLPAVDTMYPDGQDTDIKAGDPARGLETDFRPHFFDGVVNVVHRLFEHARPDMAVFGKKDFQQLQVIKDMVERLSMPIDIIGAPIVRDDHGLALSSRNAYLSADDLAIARQLNRILRNAADALEKNKDALPPATQNNSEDGLENTAPSALPVQDLILRNTGSALIETGFDKIDYVDVRWNRVLVAAWLGETRLIDNMAIS